MIPPYRAQMEESTSRSHKSAVTTGYHRTIIILCLAGHWQRHAADGMGKFEGLTCSISCRIHVKAVTPTGIAFWMRIISPLHCVFHPLAECSKRPSSKAAGESKPGAYPHGYVEEFDEPRTKLAGFFSILPR
jgi:hypothetical protein